MLNFTDKGNGHCLVFLHGFCEDRRIWDTLVPELQTDFRIICIDLPGFGKSPALSDDLTDWARACFEVLDAQKTGPFSLIGHSLGGYVALAMLEHAPERIAQFVSFHSTPLSDPKERQANRLRQVRFILENGITPFLKQLIPSLFRPGYDGPALATAQNIARTQTQEGIISALRAMKNRPDRSKVLSAYEGPTLIVSGQYDILLPLEDQKKIVKLCQNVEHQVLGNSGHMGMLEEPEESRKILTTFFMR